MEDRDSIGMRGESCPLGEPTAAPLPQESLSKVTQRGKHHAVGESGFPGGKEMIERIAPAVLPGPGSAGSFSRDYLFVLARQGLFGAVL